VVSGHALVGNVGSSENRWQSLMGSVFNRGRLLASYGLKHSVGITVEINNGLLSASNGEFMIRGLGSLHINKSSSQAASRRPSVEALMSVGSLDSGTAHTGSGKTVVVQMFQLCTRKLADAHEWMYNNDQGVKSDTHEPLNKIILAASDPSLGLPLDSVEFQQAQNALRTALSEFQEYVIMFPQDFFGQAYRFFAERILALSRPHPLIISADNWKVNLGMGGYQKSSFLPQSRLLAPDLS